MDAPRQASHLSQHLLNPLQWQDTSVFRQRLNVPVAPPALGQGGWGPRGQGLGGYNQGPGGGMGIYQGAGQGYPDTGMGIRGGYQGGFPGGGGVNQDLPFYRGQPPPDYGGYQVSAQMFNHQLETISWGGGRWVNINHHINIHHQYQSPDGSISRQATIPTTATAGRSHLVNTGRQTTV